MITFEEFLIELDACEEAIEWADNRSVEEVVKTCRRGDWLLWLAFKVDVDTRQLTLAKAHCANTVRHLMKDERSLKAVDTAIAYGQGLTGEDELYEAYIAADAHASDAFAARVAAINVGVYRGTVFTAAGAAHAAYACACTPVNAVVADETAAAAAYACAGAKLIDAKKKNQMQTADICRKYIGDLIIDKVNELRKG